MQPRPGLEGLMTPAEAKNTECVSTSQAAPQPETVTVYEASSGLPAAASLKPCLHGPLGQEETARSAAQDTAGDIHRKCRPAARSWMALQARASVPEPRGDADRGLWRGVQVFGAGLALRSRELQRRLRCQNGVARKDGIRIVQELCFFGAALAKTLAGSYGANYPPGTGGMVLRCKAGWTP